MRFRFLVATVVILFASGCQTSVTGAGSGPLHMSRSVEAHYQSYLANPNGEYFAVSTNGKHYGYSVCHEGRFNCTESSGTVALRSCHSRSGGVPSKILAVGEKLVWQGIRVGVSVPKKVKTVIGHGPISLSARAKRQFRRYLEEPYPEYFAVSFDGSYGACSVCYRENCDSPGLKSPAVSVCMRDSGGLDCKLYAHRGDVIWK